MTTPAAHQPISLAAIREAYLKFAAAENDVRRCYAAYENAIDDRDLALCELRKRLAGLVEFS